MSEQPTRSGVGSDEQTQRLVRRPSAPLPAGLDPAGRAPRPAGSNPTTEVLSLDELMDLASRRESQPRPGRAERVPPIPTDAVSAPPQPRATAVPAAAGSAPAEPSTFEEIRQQVLADAARAWAAANSRARVWLRTGDHALMAVTAVVLIFFIAVIAVAG